MTATQKNLAHLSRIEQEALARFRGRLFSEFEKHVKEVILFGSKARGDDVPASDFDILVVVDFLSRELRNKIYDLAADIEEEHNYAIHLSPLVWQADFFEQLISHERRIALDIRSEGIRI